MNTTANAVIIFGRVIDNFGDAGVCWRLARGLALRGLQVTLVLDDLSPLQWMRDPHSPSEQAVQCQLWPTDETPVTFSNNIHQLKAVIETFGCTAPDSFFQQLPRPDAAHSPTLINLEYLSAEPYVERSHLLASPQFHGPAAGLTRWFFYPGFTAKTGGLLHPTTTNDLTTASAPLSPDTDILWFAYPHTHDLEWMQHLAQGLHAAQEANAASTPIHVGLCPGHAQRHILTPKPVQHANLQLQGLNFRPQTQFDALLRHHKFNIVRGEDSFVQAQWAAQPFIWHIYPQDDGAHWGKLHAFLDLFLQHAPPQICSPLRQLWLAFNSDSRPDSWPELPPFALWQQACGAWRAHLQSQPDLITQMLEFVDRQQKPF